jgi:sulfite exporter TauE/SafE
VKLNCPWRRQSRAAAGLATSLLRTAAARPILLFLIAKLVAYTLLGLLLGWLGSLLQLSLFTRALFQLAIGIFMIGTALRMFDVHPIFRYFAFEPPSTVTRFIRRRSKLSESAVTPLFLGALTVLIPCGVTQAMMVVAMGTGNPLSGAAILFAFVLGTSPVFFTVAYLTTQLGSRLESRFKQFVAVMVLVLGLVSIDSGLNLMGSPYSFSSLAQTFAPSASAESTLVSDAPAATVVPTSKNNANTTAGNAPTTPVVITINVQNGGYSPSVQRTAGGQPFQIRLVTQNTQSCSRALVIPKLNYQKVLPVTGTTVIDVPPQPAGTELRYSCSMGMYTGKIVFN